jgi:hypothetical protein
MSKTTLTGMNSLAVMPDNTPENSSEDMLKSSNIMNTLIISLIVIVVMILLITMISQSRFIDHFSIPSAFFIFGIGLALFRGAQLMKQQTDWRFMAIISLALLAGSYLISLHNVNYAWFGSIILIITFLADAGYGLYMKWSVKKAMDDIYLWGGLICDIVLAGLLVYALTGDM